MGPNGGGNLHGSETVLIIDDEKSTLDITDEMFSMFGYNTRKADSGEKAIETYNAQKGSIDLVILDLNMPRMDGHECLKKLIGIDPEVKVIITTGELAWEKEKQILESGACALMSKPYQFRDMLNKVRELLDN